MKKFFALVFIVALAGFPGQSHSCIGPQTNYRLNFFRGDQPNVVVARLTDPDTNEAFEVEDDTGYLGANLVMVHLVKSSKLPGYSGHNPRLLAFMRERLNVFRGVLTDAVRNESARSRILEAVGRYETVLSAPSASAQDLEEADFQLYDALRQHAGLTVTARRRNVGGSWVPQVPINQLRLPNTAVARGGCNSSIGNVDVTLGLGGPAGAPAGGGRQQGVVR